MHITELQVEAFKAIKAVHLSPEATGLTVVGGRNGQGKTSVLDAIAYALGGGKRRPSNPQNDSSVNPPSIRIVLSNGLVVTRGGKTGALSVTDPTGARSGQKLLDGLISELALDLPKFLQSNSRDKAKVLLQLLGIDSELARLGQDEKRLYEERMFVGRATDSKTAYARELPEYPDAPEEPVSIQDLLSQHSAILSANAECDRLRGQAADLDQRRRIAEIRCIELRRQLQQADEELESITNQRDRAIMASEGFPCERQDTTEIEHQIASFEATNQQVAVNAAKRTAEDVAAQHRARYDDLTNEINRVRDARLSLLAGADMPLPDLTVDAEGELLYRGRQWDCMASSEQLMVAVAIVRRLNPQCEFVLLDKLEQLDVVTLQEFGAWLENEGLQAIATRVSTGRECTIIIEDGLQQGTSYIETVTGVSAEDEEEF